jgi:hypothetical protein
VIHFDHPWSTCVRDDGAPMRIYIRTRWGHWQVGEKSQVWTKKEGYTDRWAYITRRPIR